MDELARFEPGIDLDKKVHELVFRAHCANPAEFPAGDPPPYTTSFAATEKLLCLLSSSGWCVSIEPSFEQKDKKLRWVCELTAEPDPHSPAFASQPQNIAHILCLAALRNEPFVAVAETLPMAICLVALQAYGMTDADQQRELENLTINDRREWARFLAEDLESRAINVRHELAQAMVDKISTEKQVQRLSKNPKEVLERMVRKLAEKRELVDVRKKELEKIESEAFESLVTWMQTGDEAARVRAQKAIEQLKQSSTRWAERAAVARRHGNNSLAEECHFKMEVHAQRARELELMLEAASG